MPADSKLVEVIDQVVAHLRDTGEWSDINVFEQAFHEREELFSDFLVANDTFLRRYDLSHGAELHLKPAAMLASTELAEWLSPLPAVARDLAERYRAAWIEQGAPPDLSIGLETTAWQSDRSTGT